VTNLRQDSEEPADESTEVQVQTGPGVAPGIAEYTDHRLRALQRYAPRTISRIEVWVTKPRTTAAPVAVAVRAALTVGTRVLRAHAATPDLRSSLDVVCDRLRRQLTALPHGQRGDYVPHHGTTRHP